MTQGSPSTWTNSRASPSLKKGGIQMREYSNLTEPFYAVPFVPKQCKDCAYKRPDRRYSASVCLKYKISKPDAVMENTGKCKEYKKE